MRKLGGVLGATSGLGTANPTATVGIGINVSWSRDSFPPELAATMTSLTDATASAAMTSLTNAPAGPPVDREALLVAFVAGLEARVATLRDDHFDAAGWEARQALTGDLIAIHAPDGAVRFAHAVGVDTDTGALIINEDGTDRPLFVGEIRHVRPVMV
jgi:biotin-(acetyl-CoA carboxylase) ligase